MRRLTFALSSTAIVQLAGFASGIMIARLLGPAHRGELSQIIAWFSFLAPLCLVGLNDAVVYYRSVGRDGDVVLSTALIGSAATISVGLLLCVCAILLRLDHLSRSAVLGSWVFLLFVPGFHLNNIFASYFQASANVWLWTIQRIAAGPLYIALIAIAALLGHATVLGVAAANAGSFSLVVLIAAVSVVVSGGRFVRPRLGDLRQFFGYGAPLTLQKLSIVIRDNLDRMVLPFFIGAAALGNYVVAATAAYLVFIVAASIDLVGFPTIAAVRDSEARRETAEVFLSGTIILTAIGAVILMLIAPPLVVLLFGAAYRPAIPYVPLFVVAGALQGVRMVFGGVFKAYARPGVLAWIEGVNSVIMVAVMFAAVRFIGAWAGVLAHVTSAALSCALAGVLAARTLGLSPLKMIVPDRKHIEAAVRAARAMLRGRGSASA